ncbi:MAG TPA: response regulator [Niabella sp.]|nr:response regulator [Niabella sp.]HOZ95442.1 response regulator [Niabella sp.]HQW14332.1 response regulator [Niabella sp.]HQX18389.1 response regulator [Niabella sp.]HQX40119.1 response regulator [Niabella sp.]
MNMRKKEILIVEDNSEVRDFLFLCLEDDYSVFQAEDGMAGLDLAFEQIPDLVITDVAMPVMDGYQFCTSLKADIRTSHIPVIMLTAKTEVDQHVEGLECGADLYLTKPFSIKVLQSYIKNLLNAKETLRKYFSQKVLIEPLNIEIGSVDKNFMEKLLAIINLNISNPDFHINDLSRLIGMSTTVLYKKFNALTQMPVAEFIKSFRLKKAALLLKDKSLNISEVAWQVGFNDRKYFSKEFKKYFGYTPSDQPDTDNSTLE